MYMGGHIDQIPLYDDGIHRNSEALNEVVLGDNAPFDVWAGIDVE